ncbi:caffeine resistance protein, putative [Talaromyces stipitatus ATCC 10500]|uniref:Caffeine resistance protein, putative n=1 Tax=Talaromyces stipitatus (strain ATCC 10500 / CBS 375.48 / QM 6759 / NRRL 1006) TaxID=441959 RepID=B8MU86_TALSN|nr:caffeine resistance protein, putative [Talaromyces stipitatus ATCC 10500]EED11590.1 caffeine resistance protein, putative [Talaromyces stipitatus ATCC 10500]
MNWHWVSWDMLWVSTPVLILWFFFVPETSASTILYFRARRLRKITGDDKYRTKEEIDRIANKKRAFSGTPFQNQQKSMSLTRQCSSQRFTPALSMPSSILSSNHSWFKVTGLPFLAVLLTLCFATTLLASYWYLSVERHLETKGLGAFGAPERRLVPGLLVCTLNPIGLFITAWSSRPSVHWMVPILGLFLNIIGTFTVIVCMLQYIAFSYPRYAASLFAAYDFARSTLAAGVIMFSRFMFINLGLDRGISLLAFLDIICVVLLFGLWKYGGLLRAKSRFAES